MDTASVAHLGSGAFMSLSRRWQLAFVATAFCITSSLGAQSKPVKPDPEPPTSFGTVTGHVYFAGSNAPARLRARGDERCEPSGRGEGREDAIALLAQDREFVLPQPGWR